MPTSHRYFTLILALAALISPTPSTAALAAGEVALDITNYASRVEKAPYAWLLEFYSTRCGSCAAFEGTFHAFTATEDVATGFKGHVGRINIDSDGGMALAQKLGALDAGLPGVWVVPKNPPRAKLVYGPEDGNRSPEQLWGSVEAVLEKAGVQSEQGTGLFLRS
jgi:hypothetical protein